jgi:hypothetical protein
MATLTRPKPAQSALDSLTPLGGIEEYRLATAKQKHLSDQHAAARKELESLPSDASRIEVEARRILDGSSPVQRLSRSELQQRVSALAYAIELHNSEISKLREKLNKAALDSVREDYAEVLRGIADGLGTLQKALATEQRFREAMMSKAFDPAGLTPVPPILAREAVRRARDFIESCQGAGYDLPG